MNKSIFIHCLVFVLLGFLCIQNIEAAGAREGFSGSQNSLQEFKRRFSEIENNSGGISDFYW